MRDATDPMGVGGTTFDIQLISGAEFSGIIDGKQATLFTLRNKKSIVADDCSYYDIGCFGSKNTKTPNIDQIAENGIKFNRAYKSASMSTPTRLEYVPGFVENCVSLDPSYTTDGITEFMSRDNDQPFCLVLTSINPHMPSTVGDAIAILKEKVLDGISFLKVLKGKNHQNTSSQVHHEPL